MLVTEWTLRVLEFSKNNYSQEDNVLSMPGISNMINSIKEFC